MRTDILSHSIRSSGCWWVWEGNPIAPWSYAHWLESNRTIAWEEGQDSQWPGRGTGSEVGSNIRRDEGPPIKGILDGTERGLGESPRQGVAAQGESGTKLRQNLLTVGNAGHWQEKRRQTKGHYRLGDGESQEGVQRTGGISHIDLSHSVCWTNLYLSGLWLGTKI